MGQTEEAGSKTFHVMDHAASFAAEDDSPSPSSTELEKQTRTRRLFSTPQLFAFNIVYLGTWYYTGGNMYYALQNGGPAGWFFGYVIVTFGVLCQAASFAEMASIQPIAGAQYYWTHYFAPPSLKLFLTWIQGWITWTAYVALLTSSLNGSTIIWEGMIQLQHPDYANGGWHTALIIIGTLAFGAFINIYAFRLLPWFELIAGILNVCLFFVFLVVLWVLSPHHSANILVVPNISSGWENYFVSCNIGSLSSIFLFIGFESIIHLGEETRNPKKTVPRSVFWPICTNGVLGLIMIITLAICMPSVETLLNSPSPLVTILVSSAGIKGATAMASGLVAMGICGNIGVVSSVSRLTWAWARDGGLPHYFARVDGRHRVPARAVVLTCSLATALALLNLGNGPYIALGAITSLSSLACYASYAIILASVLYARFTTGIQLEEWNLGKAGPVINLVALIYTVWVVIFLPFPSNLPVTASNMNYCGPVFGAVLIGTIGWWVIRARHTWKGPNRAIVKLVLEQSA